MVKTTIEQALEDIENDKRHRIRHRYRTYGFISDGHHKWQTHILNLSFEGALVAILNDYVLKKGTDITLMVELEDHSSIILHGQVAHRKNHYLGINCRPHGPADAARLKLAIEEVSTDTPMPN